jgi:hypothetical protein
MRGQAQPSGVPAETLLGDPAAERSGLGEGRDGLVKFFPTLDHGVEWCENRILMAEGVPVGVDRDSLPVQLARVLPRAIMLLVTPSEGGSRSFSLDSRFLC